MTTGVGGNARVKGCFTAIIHIFPGTMRKQKHSLLRFQELSSLHEVHSLQVNEVLEKNNGVREIQTCGFLDSTVFNYVLKSVEKFFMHALLIADPSNLGEEEVGDC